MAGKTQCSKRTRFGSDSLNPSHSGAQAVDPFEGTEKTGKTEAQSFTSKTLVMYHGDLFLFCPLVRKLAPSFSFPICIKVLEKGGDEVGDPCSNLRAHLASKSRHQCIGVGIHQIKGATQKGGVGIHNMVHHVTETGPSDLPKNLSYHTDVGKSSGCIKG